MQLIFRTQSHAARVPWCQYALLRDNVQHYLESGPGQATFFALHAVEHAVDGEVEHVSALELRRELQRAWNALAELRLADSAISLRTRAILAGFEPPQVRGTFQAVQSGWPLPVEGDDSDQLHQHVRSLIEALLTLTDQMSASDEVTISVAAARRD